MLALYLALSWAVASIVSLEGGTALAAPSLPDSRAWEMVSPLEKNGGEVNGIGGAPEESLPDGGIVQASADGSAITYVSLLAFAGSQGEPRGAPLASQYLSKHKVDGWSTENLTAATRSGGYALAGQGAPYKAFSTDLSKSLMLNGERPVETTPPELPADAPSEYENYYLRNNTDGAFEAALLTNAPPEGPNEAYLLLEGATPDLGHIIVGARAALTPEATPQSRGNLYEWAEGRLWPINVLPLLSHLEHPEQTASGGASLGMEEDESQTISEDGSRVFWEQSETASLFVRNNAGRPESPVDGAGNCIVPSDACTIQIDASKIEKAAAPIEEGGHGEFKTASANGARAFFTDRQRLVSGSTAGGEEAHQDLYMFNVETGRLTDLTVDSADQGGASVLGVLGASDDGAYVYFVAEGRLARGASEGKDNLYVWHETPAGEMSTSLVATLSGDDQGHRGFGAREPIVAHDWSNSTGIRTERVTHDGRHLAFMSDARLTNYDNAGYEEVYLYEVDSGRPTCASCRLSGGRPTGPSGIPGGTPWRTSEELGTYQSRVLNEEGTRVFFDSRDQIVPEDANGVVQDVYEWEQDGTGSCKREGGCIFLLSAGTSSSESAFVDASQNGNDAFFITRAQLEGQDKDQLRDLYDASVGGGFPSTPTRLPCEEEGCLSPVSAQPMSISPASSTFSGVGNISPASSQVVIKKAKGNAKNRGRHKRHRTLAPKTGRKAIRHARTSVRLWRRR